MSSASGRPAPRQRTLTRWRARRPDRTVRTGRLTEWRRRRLRARHRPRTAVAWSRRRISSRRRPGCRCSRGAATPSTRRSRPTPRSRSPGRTCAGWAATCSRSSTPGLPVHALNSTRPRRQRRRRRSAPRRGASRDAVPSRRPHRHRARAASTAGWRSTSATARCRWPTVLAAGDRARRGRLPGVAAAGRRARRSSTTPGGEQLAELASQATRPGARVRRPGAARALRAIVDERPGRLLPRRVRRRAARARWRVVLPQPISANPARRGCEPSRPDTFGTTLHTMPPNSQGYLLLGAAALAERARPPRRPGRSRAGPICSSRRRRPPAATAPTVLHDRADGAALVAAIAARARRGRLRSGVATIARAVPSTATRRTCASSTTSGWGCR